MAVRPQADVIARGVTVQRQEGLVWSSGLLCSAHRRPPSPVAPRSTADRRSCMPTSPRQRARRALSTGRRYGTADTSPSRLASPQLIRGSSCHLDWPRYACQDERPIGMARPQCHDRRARCDREQYPRGEPVGSASGCANHTAHGGEKTKLMMRDSHGCLCARHPPRRLLAGLERKQR